MSLNANARAATVSAARSIPFTRSLAGRMLLVGILPGALIISGIIAYGMTDLYRELQLDSESEMQQQALATAGSLFIGLLSDRLPGVGVESLTIESDAQTGRAVSRVEGGKYIAENLFVSGIYIPQAAEDENDFEVALDWIVVRLGADSLRLTLRGGNLGNGGLELLYNMLLQ
jgi:hypothetical protein